MEKELKDLCKSFIKNKDLIKGTIGWQSPYIYPICAAMYVDKRVEVNPSKLLECKEILKSKTGIFSNFRAIPELTVIVMMSLSENPEETLERSLKIYEKFKESYWASQYLPVASMIISESDKKEYYEKICLRSKEIYKLMKSEHPFLTGGEDSVFATILALSEKSNEEMIRDMESCYEILKPEFFSKNSVQSLTHVLGLVEGVPSEKCRKVMELFNKLKDRGHKYSTGYELSTLGVLAMIPVDTNTLVSQLLEVDEYLSKENGYGILGLGKKQRLMHAGMILNSYYLRDRENLMKGATISATLALITAQQAATMTAISASIAASSSSSN